MPTTLSIPIEQLKENHDVLERFSQCLDRAFGHIKYWLHFAEVMRVESNIITQCNLYSENSPTVKLFEYLKAKRPQLLIQELLSALMEIKRIDIHQMIVKTFKDGDKVSEVITDSPSDILDNIALKLDSANRPVPNWEKLAKELGVLREVYRKFEMNSEYNPTVALVRYLYTTSEKPIAFKDFVKCFRSMKREDVIREVENCYKLKDIKDLNAKEVLKLGSDLLQKVADLLNKDVPGDVEGWRGLGRYFKVDSSIMDSLNPPPEKEVHSPTTKIINWLAASRPSTTINDIMKALEKIKRCDAMKILIYYFDIDFPYDGSNVKELAGIVSDLGEVIDDSEPKNVDRGRDTPTLFGIQATEQQKTNIFQEEGDRTFGVPSKTIKIIGQDNEKSKLLISLTSGDAQMVVLHAAKGCGKTTLVINVAHDIVEEPYRYTVVYVDSKDVFSLEDLAYKILKTCGILSLQSCPISQVRQLFRDSNKDCVLIIENLDHMYHSIEKWNETSKNQTGSPADELPWEKSTVSSKKTDFQGFLKDLAERSSKLKIFVTTWESVAFTSIKVKQMKLSLLNYDESLALLRSRSGLPLDDLAVEVKPIIKCCGGIPLLLCAAVVFLSELGSVKEGAKKLASSSPEEQLNTLCPDSLPDDERLDHCLGICFKRMSPCSRKVLVLLSVFPNVFTLEEAKHISKESEIDDDQLEEGFQTLRKFCFLNNFEAGTYNLHSVIRSFGILEARKEDDLKSVFDAARWGFIRYTFDILTKIEEEFFSTQCGSAIRNYRLQDENIREIARWCITDRNMDLKVKQFCIESFISSQYVLLKIMRSHPMKFILCKFAQLCQKEKTMSELYCECLILGGAKIVIGCLCTPYLCSAALKEANWCFLRVYNFFTETKNRKTSAIAAVEELPSSEELDKINNCGVISDRAKAQFFIKFGKCLVRYGRKDCGMPYLKNGIKIRHQCYKKDPCEKSLVMLAVGYNDLAAAHTFVREHTDAISIRKTIVLPIYEKMLGNHPFTATAQSGLARNYLELGEYDKAVQANDIALRYRTTLLGDHQDTARSLFDKGAILSEQASMSKEESVGLYEGALENLERAFDMQHALLDTPEETAKTLQEMVVVLDALERKEETEKRQKELSECVKKIEKYYHQRV